MLKFLSNDFPQARMCHNSLFNLRNSSPDLSHSVTKFALIWCGNLRSHIRNELDSYVLWPQKWKRVLNRPSHTRGSPRHFSIFRSCFFIARNKLILRYFFAGIMDIDVENTSIRKLKNYCETCFPQSEDIVSVRGKYVDLLEFSNVRHNVLNIILWEILVQRHCISHHELVKRSSSHLSRFQVLHKIEWKTIKNI